MSHNRHQRARNAFAVWALLATAALSATLFAGGGGVALASYAAPGTQWHALGNGLQGLALLCAACFAGAGALALCYAADVLATRPARKPASRYARRQQGRARLGLPARRR